MHEIIPIKMSQITKSSKSLHKSMKKYSVSSTLVRFFNLVILLFDTRKIDKFRSLGMTVG